MKMWKRCLCGQHMECWRVSRASLQSFLFGLKWCIGFFLHSISIMADAFNNLSDAGSSIISLVGVKIAERPADEEHPFGHGRVEYIAALVVAFLVLEVGFTFLKMPFLK